MSLRLNLLLCAALGAGLVGGCLPPTAPNGDEGGDDALRTIDGHWLITEYAEHDQLTASSVVEFWHLKSVGTDGGDVLFSISASCTPDIELASGRLTPEGLLEIHDDDAGYLRTFARFTNDHEFVGVEWDAGHRMVAQRIEPPACGMLPGSEQPGVTTHLLTHATEEEEELATLAPKDRQQQQSGAPSGLAHLEQARGARLPLGDDYEHTDGETTLDCEDEMGNPMPCPDDPDAGHAGFVECSVQNWSESRQAQLADVVALGNPDQIYPGALLQGGSFAGGAFTPITIPRASGRITLHGLTLAGPPLCPELRTPYTACVDAISNASVTDAVAQILQNSEVLGTRAEASLNVEQVYSAEHFIFKLGVDVSASGLPASIGGNLNLDASRKENVVVLRFTQVFYNVSFEPPQRPFSVFRDGAEFDDPDDQIGADNPPLYVSNVKYGRQVFLFFYSSYGSALVEAALRGAGNLEGADVMVDGQLSYEQIMSNTRVTYVVLGGDAGLALGPIDTAGPDEMYEAVRGLLANREAAEYSASNPGIPVAYTLNYLVNNRVAATSYSVTYDRRDCRTYPPTDYHYTLRITNPRQSAWIYLDNTKNLIAGPYRAGTGRVDLDLNDWLTDSGDHTLIIQLYGRCLWESASARWNLLVDGSSRWSDSVSKSWLQTCKLQNAIFGAVGTLVPNQVYEARLRVSRRNGKVQLLGRAE